MPRPNMISGNYNYLGVGGHYKSGLAGLGNVSKGELDNAGLSIGEWQHLIAQLNDDAAYGPGGYYNEGLHVRPVPIGMGLHRGFQGIGYTIPYMLDMDTPVGPGASDYMSSVQAFESNANNKPVGINAGWFQANWKALVGGAVVAMLLLPKGRRY